MPGARRATGCGSSSPSSTASAAAPTAQAYAIRSLAEARAYLGHPLLGPRLRECCEALLATEADDPAAVMGGVDALKLRSSVTLFIRAAPEDELLPRVLAKFYGGEPDDATDRLLAA